jgi:hypothetical protein
MADIPDSKVICTCAEISRGQFLDAMAENRDVEFGALLEKINAGMKCTACRLDLELLYTDNFDRVVGRNMAAKTQVNRDAVSFKQRLYSFIDGIAPMVPLRLSNTVPVLCCPGVKQYVAVCNDAPLYQNSTPEPAQVRLIVRDAEGRICADQRHEVTIEQPLDVELAGLLPEPKDGKPGVGSVEVVRSWQRPSQRGTTRPQILIEAPGGCGAVHTQAPNPPGDTWYTCLARPGEERMMLGIVNPSPRALHVSIDYPFASGAEARNRQKATIAPHGALLHEVVLQDAEAAQLKERPYGVRCTADGTNKCYLITASPALDRFAIDHPASG